MRRWTALFLGAAAFLAAHLVEVREWQRWFAPGSDFAPWFLNAGRAVAFTAVCLFLAGVITGAVGPRTLREGAVLGGYAAAGAALAMTTVLVAAGPGTIFPIVLAVGYVVAAASAVSGALVGGAIRPPHP